MLSKICKMKICEDWDTGSYKNLGISACTDSHKTLDNVHYGLS